jgi:hypothetical protein
LNRIAVPGYSAETAKKGDHTMIDRRSFIAAVVSGAFTLRHINVLRAFIENHGEPLLERPRKATDVLYLSTDFEPGEFRIHLGKPNDSPSFANMTNREYIDEFMGGWSDAWLDDDLAPDEPVCEWWAFENWYPTHSSDAQAFEFLQSIDLDLPERRGREGDGWIEFTDGPCPGNDSRFVDVDALGASLLQQRLNALNQGVRIELI